MNYRLRTSKDTEKILLELKTKLSTIITPNILSRLAIGLSLRLDNMSKKKIEKILKKYDSNGLEFQRPTLTGENEIAFKVLMEQYCGEHLTDSEFFPKHFKFHLERGIFLLRSEMNISSNFEIFITNLMNLLEDNNSL